MALGKDNRIGCMSKGVRAVSKRTACGKRARRSTEEKSVEKAVDEAEVSAEADHDRFRSQHDCCKVSAQPSRSRRGTRKKKQN